MLGFVELCHSDLSGYKPGTELEEEARDQHLYFPVDNYLVNNQEVELECDAGFTAVPKGQSPASLMCESTQYKLKKKGCHMLRCQCVNISLPGRC